MKVLRKIPIVAVGTVAAVTALAVYGIKKNSELKDEIKENGGKILDGAKGVKNTVAKAVANSKDAVMNYVDSTVHKVNIEDEMDEYEDIEPNEVSSGDEETTDIYADETNVNDEGDTNE